jgi:hypothetical protein
VKAGLQRLCFYRLRSLQACRMDNGAANGDVAIRGTRDLSPLSQGSTVLRHQRKEGHHGSPRGPYVSRGRRRMSDDR